MLLPILLIILAVLPAAMYAYGTEPTWGSYAHGISMIIWSRRLEWPLIVTSLLMCAGLLVLVVSGKRRVAWLIGLLPVLALFMHRSAHGPAAGFSSIQDPLYISPEGVRALPANDLIVGFNLDGKSYAFPCTSLFLRPIAVGSGREKSFVIFWNAWANRASVFVCDRDLRAADLEIVSSPLNTLVVYNSRLGEFINGITGRTFSGTTPTGLHTQLDVVKTTLQNWQMLHPDGLMAAIPGADGDFTQPQPEKYPLPGRNPLLKNARRVCVVAATQPIAVPSEAITDRPLNLKSGRTSLLLVRVNGIVRAYDRELPGELIPRFAPVADPKHKTAAWIDSDTNSEWSDTGIVVEGPKEMHGLLLRAIPLEDDLYLNEMAYWYPNLHFTTDAEIAEAVIVEKHAVDKPSKGPKRHSPTP